MTKRIAAVLGTVSLVVLSSWLVLRTQTAAAANSDWLTDMQEAQNIASQEKKDLLINFTGSDWCGWCIRLREEVFDQEEFDKAQDDFVMVMMDFPSDESIIPAKVREQNQTWSNKLGIEGFPTVVLTDASGRPYGSLGYTPGGPEAFLSELEKLKKVRQVRDEKLAAAKKATGVEKAKLLDEALASIPDNYRLPMYRDEVQDIIAADDQNQAGLKTEYTKILQEAEAEQFLKELQDEVQAAFGEEGPEAALKQVQKAQKSKEAQSNPVLRTHLAQAEVHLLVNFEKSDEALKRLEELIADESFSKEQQREFRQTQATVLKDTGETEQALKAYDALLADADTPAEEQLKYLTDKAELLTDAERPQEALDVYESALKKTEKGTNEWLIVQVSRGDLLAKSDQSKAAADVYDEMLTLETLAPVQQAMLLVRSAEAHHAAKQTQETQTRVQKADEILKELGESEQIPPQLIEELEERLNAVRNEEGKEEAQSKKE